MITKALVEEVKRMRSFPEDSVERRVVEVVTAPINRKKYLPTQNVMTAYGFKASLFEIETHHPLRSPNPKQYKVEGE